MGQGITTAGLGAPDYAKALRQHARYVRALEQADLKVTVLSPLDRFPDSYFVEDAAVVFPEVGVIARSGAESRRGEETEIKKALRPFRRTVSIEAPGTLDGGDVLIAGRRVFIGLSSRTSEAGALQLRAILEPFGYEVQTVPVKSGLHLKSSVNTVSENTLVVTSEYSTEKIFDAFARIVVADGEAYGANSLWVNDRILIPDGCQELRRALEAGGHTVIELDVSEMRKMDGGLTCMSLRF